MEQQKGRVRTHAGLERGEAMRKRWMKKREAEMLRFVLPFILVKAICRLSLGLNGETSALGKVEPARKLRQSRNIQVFRGGKAKLRYFYLLVALGIFYPQRPPEEGYMRFTVTNLQHFRVGSHLTIQNTLCK